MSQVSVDPAPLGGSWITVEKHCRDSYQTWGTKDRPLGSGELGRFVNQTKSTHQSMGIQL